MIDDDPEPAPLSVLALHGLGGGRFELASLIERLERMGCRVDAPTLPGHHVDGPVMPTSNWEDWARTAEQAFDKLAEAGRPVVVVGFSRRPVARLILLAPFLAIRYIGLIPFRPLTYLRPIARIMPQLPRRSPPLRDRQARRLLDQVVRFQTFSLGATLSALELIDRVKPLVPEIKATTLILQGKHDTVVDPAGARWLMKNLGSLDKNLVWFAKSDHLLTLDHDREMVIRSCEEFLSGLIGSV
jgi:carboxylesterase